MKTDELTKFSCVACLTKLSLKRFVKGSCTCSTACFEQVRQERNRLKHRNHCRACHRPTTPEQVRSWQKWAKANQLSLPRGRPKKAKQPTKTVAEGASVGQAESTAQKRSQSQSRNEVNE